MEEIIKVVVVSVVVISIHIFSIRTAGPLVVFFDVGQGDGAMVSLDSFQMIIDGGPGIELVSKVGRYMNNFDRTIEIVVITHWHSDHYYGIYELLKRNNVEKIYLPYSVCDQSGQVEEILNRIGNRGEVVKTEIDISIDSLDISIYPSFSTQCVKSQKETNNSSLVTNVGYKGISIAMMGDIESNVEDKYNFDIDILKAGHHCSDTSSSTDFLNRVSPLVVICSYGQNFYGHPSKRLLENLDNMDIKYLETFKEGDIKVNLKKRLIYNERNKLLMKL